MVATEKKVLSHNKNFHIWMTMVPGRITRNGGCRTWSIGFSINCNDADIQGYFFCDSEREEYDLRAKPVHEMGMTTVSFDDFLISSRDLQRKTFRAKNGYLEIAARLRIYLPQNAYTTQVKVEPIFVASECISEPEETFDLGDLLLSTEGRKTADCVIYARNEKIDYVSFVLISEQRFIIDSGSQCYFGSPFPRTFEAVPRNSRRRNPADRR